LKIFQLWIGEENNGFQKVSICDDFNLYNFFAKFGTTPAVTGAASGCIVIKSPPLRGNIFVHIL
jgi:hypothetical protein